MLHFGSELRVRSTNPEFRIREIRTRVFPPAVRTSGWSRWRTGGAMATTLRHPAVAGRFYPHDRASLRDEAGAYLTDVQSRGPIRVLGCIAPHAGYMYSGHVAGAVFARTEVPQCCIVLCPNHTGMGPALSIMSEGAWETPLRS